MALFEEVLRTNYDNYEQFSVNSSSDDKKSFTSFDIRQAAINAEYEIFSSNKVVTTYRRKMAFLMAEVKKKTDAWEMHNILSEYDPDKLNSSSTSELTKYDTTLSNSTSTMNNGFQTALTLSKNIELTKNKGMYLICFVIYIKGYCLLIYHEYISIIFYCFLFFKVKQLLIQKTSHLILTLRRLNKKLQLRIVITVIVKVN